MNETATESVLAQLQRRNPRYADSAYLFVLTALHGRLAQLDVPRHISGAEVADAVRSLALERFGAMARTVLEHWGVHSTADMGEIVFALVDCGVLIKQPPLALLPLAWRTNAPLIAPRGSCLRTLLRT